MAMDLTFDMAKKNPIFRDRWVLTRLQPPRGEFLHREKQKNALILELAPLLSNQRASNLFVYGLQGTGKTALLTHLSEQLHDQAQKDAIHLKTAYVNCAQAKTDTLILSAMLRQVGASLKNHRSGVNRSQVLRDFLQVLRDETLNLLIVLDEIDQVLKHSGDDILYLLSRFQDDVQVKANLCTVIISNDVKVPSYLQPRTHSSFGRTKIVFPR